MSDTKKTQWWIFPRDAQTNETISDLLAGLQSKDLSSENVECSDGKKRDMWRVPDYSFVSRMSRSRKNGMRIDFTPFNSQGEAKPSEWRFEGRKKISPEKIRERSDKIKLAALMPQHRKHAAAG